MLRSVAIAAFVVASSLALSGCAFLEPTPVITPSPTPTVVDTSTFIGTVIDPAGTVWQGRDSGGDKTTFTLHDDGTVAVRYGDHDYDDPNDTWSVIDGVLHIEIHLDAVNGEAEYVGTWNPESTSIDATMTTSLSGRTLTVTLTQQ